jgi:hypothetical protein
MPLIKEQNKSSVPLSTTFLLMGLFAAIVGYETCNERVGEGQLTSINITIKKRPGYVNRTKKTPAHYRVYANEYLSPFWISGKGLSNIEDNDSLLRSFQQKQVNDTLQVIFLSSRQNSLDNPIEPVDVYGLADPEQEYFSPGMISRANDKTTKIIFFCSMALLITGLVMKLKKAFTPSAT